MGRHRACDVMAIYSRLHDERTHWQNANFIWLLGSQITCFPPSSFSLRQAAYVDSFCWAAVESHSTDNSAPLRLHKVLQWDLCFVHDINATFNIFRGSSVLIFLSSVSLSAVLSLYTIAGRHHHVYSCSVVAFHGYPVPFLWPQFYHGGTWPLLQSCHPSSKEPNIQPWWQRHYRRSTQVYCDMSVE